MFYIHQFGINIKRPNTTDKTNNMGHIIMGHSYHFTDINIITISYHYS